MLLLPPLALDIMLQWKCGAVIQWRKALAGLFIAPLGLVSFMVYLWYRVGDPLAFVHAQQFWMRETVAPWTALERSFYAMLHPPSPVTDQYLRNVFNLHVVGSFITILLAARRMLRLSEGLYSMLLFVLVLSSVIPGGDVLQSSGRYLMVLFPVYLTLARWGKHPLSLPYRKYKRIMRHA
jgi:hypothetical protein